MDINDVAVFVAAHSGGSLASAARQLGRTPMAVSRGLAALERELGVRLMHRTTRAVALTPEGEEFLPFARTILDAADEAHGTLRPASRGAAGLLRVTAPAAFGRIGVMPLIPRLLDDNPALRIDLMLSDAIVDIAGSGIDVAIRIAPLRDSALVARALAPNPRVLCATPDYLQRHGVPGVLADLEQHSCLPLSNMAYWPFVVGDQIRSVRIDGRFQCSSIEGVRTACLQGLGLALLTYWDVRAELGNGSLVAIALRDAHPQQLSIWAVLPTRKYVPRRVRVFLEALEHSLADDAPRP
jgi:DNA-binding transcriptional LysR family regulator